MAAWPGESGDKTARPMAWRRRVPAWRRRRRRATEKRRAPEGSWLHLTRRAAVRASTPSTGTSGTTGLQGRHLPGQVRFTGSVRRADAGVTGGTPAGKLFRHRFYRSGDKREAEFTVVTRSGKAFGGWKRRKRYALPGRGQAYLCLRFLDRVKQGVSGRIWRASGSGGQSRVFYVYNGFTALYALQYKPIWRAAASGEAAPGLPARKGHLRKGLPGLRFTSLSQHLQHRTLQGGLTAAGAGQGTYTRLPGYGKVRTGSARVYGREAFKRLRRRKRAWCLQAGTVSRGQQA